MLIANTFQDSKQIHSYDFQVVHIRISRTTLSYPKTELLRYKYSSIVATPPIAQLLVQIGTASLQLVSRLSKHPGSVTTPDVVGSYKPWAGASCSSTHRWGCKAPACGTLLAQDSSSILHRAAAAPNRAGHLSSTRHIQSAPSNILNP